MPKEHTREELKELLRGAGREVASEMLESACMDAKDANMMNNQMKVLTFMAIHVMATQLYNIERQKKFDPEEAIKLLLSDVRNELQWLRDRPADELQISGPGAG